MTAVEIVLASSEHRVSIAIGLHSLWHDLLNACLLVCHKCVLVKLDMH